MKKLILGLLLLYCFIYTSKNLHAITWPDYDGYSSDSHQITPSQSDHTKSSPEACTPCDNPCEENENCIVIPVETEE